MLCTHTQRLLTCAWILHTCPQILHAFAPILHTFAWILHTYTKTTHMGSDTKHMHKDYTPQHGYCTHTQCYIHKDIFMDTAHICYAIHTYTKTTHLCMDTTHICAYTIRICANISHMSMNMLYTHVRTQRYAHMHGYYRHVQVEVGHRQPLQSHDCRIFTSPETRPEDAADGKLHYIKVRLFHARTSTTRTHAHETRTSTNAAHTETGKLHARTPVLHIRSHARARIRTSFCPCAKKHTRTHARTRARTRAQDEPRPRFSWKEKANGDKRRH